MKYLLPLVFLLAFSYSCGDDCPTCPRDGSIVTNRTWHIKQDGTGDAPTIQAGIDSAAAGDTLLVAPGTYSDTTHVRIDQEMKAVNVHLYKSIKLLAEGAPFNTMIDGSKSDIAIYAEGIDRSGEIRGFTIRTYFGGYACVDGGFSSRTSMQFSEGVSIYCDNSDLLISANELIDNICSINLENSPVVIKGNRILRSILGINCNERSDATIQYNDINECGIAILSYDLTSRPAIIENDISEGCNGILSHGSLIAGNRLSSFNKAIVAGPKTIIEDNVFVDINGTYEAISLGDSALVRNNLFYNIGAAIYYSGKGSVVEHNTVDKAGMFIFAESLGSLTIRNNIVSRATSGISAPVNTYVIECNNLFDIAGEKYGWALSDQTGINGNISVDPKYCDAEGSDYLLFGDSPCAPGNHPDGYECGLIGAFPVGCMARDTR